MPHRAETLQNCVILLSTVTSIFHRASLPCFINFPAFLDRAFQCFSYTILLSCYRNV